MDSKTRIIVAIALIAFGLFLLFVFNSKPVPPTAFHQHADFKVYINGQVVDFAKEKFMSDQNKQLSEFVHLHDLDEPVIHQHKAGIILSDFFKSIGMEFDSNCFTLDTRQKFCNEGDKMLKMFVNGQPNSQFGNYEFKDLDRILITYGNESQQQIQDQIQSVSDRSCILSEKCPERGPAPPETSCTLSAGCLDPQQ